MARTTLARAAHTLLSRHALIPAMDVVRLWRPSTGETERAYREGMRWRRAVQDWPEDRRRDWVLNRLREVVRHAARETEFYRERFRQVGFDPASDFNFEQFATLPTLERSHLRDDGLRMRARDVAPPDLRQDSTGGSTGAPVHYVTGPRERGWIASASDHFLQRIGLYRGERVALLWAHHLDPLDRSALADRVRDWVQNVTWYDCIRLDPERLLSYHAAMERDRPMGIIAYAGVLASVAEVIEERGLRPSYPGRAMVTGAEKLWAHQRAVVERVFSAPVHERYGSRDVGLMAFQLAPPQSLAFTVDWSNVLVEPETDDPESAILVTKLHADAQPMIRYRIGDAARFASGSHPGHPAFTLDEIVGRHADRLVRRDGRWVHGLGVPHLMKGFPIREYQLVQQHDYSVDVRVIPATGFSSEHRAEIARILGANLGDVPIRIESVTEIERPAGKWRPVISLVAQSLMAGSRP